MSSFGLLDERTAESSAGEGNLMTTPSRDEPAPDSQCPCGHAADEHDALATRYCQATVRGALDRLCMCYPAPASTRLSYDGVAR